VRNDLWELGSAPIFYISPPAAATAKEVAAAGRAGISTGDVCETHC
jgi:hypothetical protein